MIREPHSAALERTLHNSTDHVSSLIAKVEVCLALSKRLGYSTNWQQSVRFTLSAIDLLPVSAAVVERASRVEGLRTLDALHVASALHFGPQLDSFITYDKRLAQVAEYAGLPVHIPTD